MAKVVIFGSGFLGGFLRRSLLLRGHELALKSKAEVDYTDFQTLQQFLSQQQVDYVINASGYTGRPNIDAAEDEKPLCWRLNVEVAATLGAAVAQSQSAKLIHISSGCIYNGYRNTFSEQHEPNFGLFEPKSSFYAKSKHAAETVLRDYPVYSLRIRMPFSSQLTPRNYFYKLMNYDRLISTPNSLTCVEDFGDVVNSVMNHPDLPFGEYNVVNPGSATAAEIVEMLGKFGVKNPSHRFIDRSELNTKAARSNVILDTTKCREAGLEMPLVGKSLRKSVAQFAEKWRAVKWDS